MLEDVGMPALRVEAGEVFWEGETRDERRETSSLTILRLPKVALATLNLAPHC
jgi:hypothetical protein